MTDSEKLRALATWFDITDAMKNKELFDNEVQIDLRAMADRIEQSHKPVVVRESPPVKEEIDLYLKGQRDIFTDTLILTPYINQQKNINPVKARFDNILKESFFNDLSQLSKITRYEYKTYRKVGNAVLDYTDKLLKQNNITFKQKP